MKLDEQDDQRKSEQDREYLGQLLRGQMFDLRIKTPLLHEPQLEIGYDPSALYDYIKDNWPDKHIAELLILLLDLPPVELS